MDDVSIKQAALLSGCRVLVLEDDCMLSDALAMVLQDEGADVVGPVGRASEALALLADRGNPVDLAVLDVELNGERSYPVADALLERGIPFLFTTGHTADAVDVAYRGYPRCEKPLSSRVLIASLTRIMSGMAGRSP